MQVQVSTEHAIRIVRYLHLQDRRVHSAQEISWGLGLSYPVFVKVAGVLKRAGILSAVHGRNGGFQLNKPAHEISVYDILVIIEGEPKSSQQNASEQCEVRTYFDGVQARMIDTLTRTNVAKL
ncbi:MAG: Rrf2 family transcriptional regulator [Oscillospiraceae bacterium]|nr:Rrf2 family transcriptional regulator [Oscillospiraceae bacterium]